MPHPFDKPWTEIEAGLRELAQRQNIRYEHAIIQALNPREDWSQHVQSSECLDLSDLTSRWPNLSRQDKEHLRECGFCQLLVRAAFPVLTFEPLSKHEEIAFADELPEAEGCPFRYAGGWFGPNIVHFLPMRKDYDHYQDCMYCLLLIQYYNFQRRNFGRCLDAKTWQVFPAYHPDDQKVIADHIRSCGNELGYCTFWAPFRLEFNLRRDWRLFNKLRRQPALVRRFRQFVRERIKKPIGDFISSWRFHFGPDAMFSRRHPWAVWDDTDRMLKLLRGEGLDSTEQLYRDVLTGKTQAAYAVLKLWYELPRPRKDWAKYLVPEYPFQYQRFQLEVYLCRDARARKLGITMEQLAELEEREVEEIDALVENGDISHN